MHRFWPYVITGLLMLCSCSGSDSGNPSADTLKSGDNDPMIADSIAAPSLKDTAGLDEYGKDSLKISAAFQHAANVLSRAYREKDVVTYAQFTPPAIIKMYGGADIYRSKVKAYMQQDSLVFTRVVCGPVKRIQPAIDNEGYAHGWYCLMPVRRFRNSGGKEIMEIQWLGGQTLDLGKTIYFLDVTGKPREQIMQIMPDLRFVLDQEALP